MKSYASPLKITKKSKSSQLLKTLQYQKKDIIRLSHEILDLKLKLWANKASKDWLDLQNTQNPFSDSIFFQELRAKYELCKGTKVEKPLLGLIKAYEKFSILSSKSNFITTEKEDALQTYHQITNSLNEEILLKEKIKDLQKFSEDKEKITNELETKLKTLRQDIQELKIYLDTSQVKHLLESKKQLISDTQKCIEDQKVILIEISKIDQTIELEKNVSTITAETSSKLYKKAINDIEKSMSETLKKIRIKEKVKEKIRMGLDRFGLKNRRKSDTLMVKTCRNSVNLYSPIGREERSICLSPTNRVLRKSGNLYGERGNAIMILSNGVDLTSLSKIEQTLSKFGNEQQSLARRLVQLNRGELSLK